MNQKQYSLVASVIIPTFNRKESLLRTLDSLCAQTLPSGSYEVIIVDDGSSDATGEVTTRETPFTLRYVRQVNRGATLARNLGASKSKGEVLIFLDDDIVISKETLKNLARECLRQEKVIVMGRITAPIHLKISGTTYFDEASISSVGRVDTNEFVNFTECQTGLLSIRKKDFLALGMLQDPTGGWPNWDDVDLGYRAYLEGFKIQRVYSAVGEHWDDAQTDLTKACSRWQQASRSAVRLFQRHPDLQPYIPMFYDKTPIDIHYDSPRLLVRKLARHVSSWRPVLRGMELLVGFLQQRYPTSLLLRPLHRWIIGGHIFLGFREGLSRFGPVQTAQDLETLNS